MLTDFLVHQRLCKRGRVLLVVTEFAEANDIDHDIFLELHTEIECDLRRKHNRLRIITVHMQHGCFDHLDDVGAIQGRA